MEERSESTKVIIDNYQCGYQATKHLIEQGCRRIVMVTASLRTQRMCEAFKGYKAALADSGLPFDEQHLLIKDLSEKCGVEAARQICKWQPLPDGAFITNDFSAAVCMQHLKEQGVRIPEDIAVVGFNNDTIGRIVEPSLTTIDYRARICVKLPPKSDQSPAGHFQYQAYQYHCIRSDLIIRKSS